jgi:hypothetical protein
MATFKHSGHCGDILYSLPTVRALGGGMYYINPGKITNMTNILAESLAPLIQCQKYITGVQIWHGQPIDYDLDKFREIRNLSHKNLADAHLVKFGHAVSERDKPWLYVNDPIECDILINRTKRYHGKIFDWRALIDTHKDRDIRFVGLKDEYTAFCKDFDVIIPFHPTKNFLELARLIAGSNIFCGNQSSPLATAIGLGVTAEVEVDPTTPNCRFCRPNIKYHYSYPPCPSGYRVV